MIRSIKIENYKSILDLEVEAGRFNVIIGGNGVGKSNFLEALVLFGAADADKLDNEFLVSRGARLVEFLPLFYDINDSIINLTIKADEFDYGIKIERLGATHKYQKDISRNEATPDDALDIITRIEKAEDTTFFLEKKIAELESSKEKYSKSKDDDLRSLGKQLESLLISLKENINSQKDHIATIKKNLTIIPDFILYSPENTALRNFYREGQIEPLGINGEGLLKLLKVMQEIEADAFQDVLKCLDLFDWFEKIEVPKDLSSLEDKVSIKDKYLTTMFDQRSANEGFLFVLFYAALFCSNNTPSIFAIDNIDASFNPKLCTALITRLVHLSKKYDKQVFVTTHNPAILDGLDLGDEEQRLFVASRNKKGHTRFKRIGLADKPKSPANGEPVKLSEAFMRGYLGGLPKNF
ncbi:putative ATPase [Fluviicoccus keumensis]|uniref:Putative ATPase n=1 Tax=Fluviicoccus keumensis TaxID=1435465 RepID=A0A4Q7ZAJ1_9GAMM|nr:AAA family ATPase [Fluviicoccus keumensis]RZU47607.1 putative ATPase [Fluviicoccus keumensis]